MKTDFEKKLHTYIEGVQSGELVAGELLKLSVKRYLNDLKNGYELRTGVFNRCCGFIGKLQHYTGLSRGKRFDLEGWQLFIVANIVGLYRTGTNLRKYNYSYIQIARKNGKTFMMAALALYYLLFDDWAAEVVLSANTFQQSQLMYNVCQTLMAQIDPNLKYHTFHRGKDIIFRSTNSILHTIATKSRGLDGFNVSFAVIDEYHAAADASVRNVLASSMGMRENPHLSVITTAGFNLESVCFQLRNDCVDVLKGLSPDNNTFSAIFELDAGDTIEFSDAAKRKWAKSNPNLGVTVRPDWLEAQVRTSQEFKTEEVNVITKNFNMWVNGAQAWIDEKHLKFETLPAFKKTDTLAYVGIDLSSVSDLTAVNYLIKKNEIYYFDTRYYLPEKFVTVSNYNKMKFREWAEQGHLTLTPGNVTDYDYILNDLLVYPYLINGVYYDTYNATQFAISATMKGMNMVPYSQSQGSFNRPTKEMERLILTGMAVFNPNPLTLYCYRNVKLRQDYMGNVKPDKSDRLNKIDGVIAQLMSLAGYLLNPVMPSVI
jgi:phage terminase large subunit-like protein